MRFLHLSAIALLAFALSPAVADAHRDRDRSLPEKCSAGPTPDGYMKAITMISDGTIDDALTAQLDPTDFWMGTLGWDADDIEQNRQDALAFFEERFGLDGEQLMAEGRAIFYPFIVNPGGDYRATTVSGEAVSGAGWNNVDTGWQLMITDPAGVELPSGQFAGVLMPANSFVVFGSYYIEPTGIPRRCGRSYRPEPIYITYQSGCPIIPDMAGIITFICELSHPMYGPGQAAGTSMAKFGPGGELTFSTRNYLTFPPSPMADDDGDRGGRGRGR